MKQLTFAVNHIAEDGTVLARCKQLGKDSASFKFLKSDFPEEPQKHGDFAIVCENVHASGKYLKAADYKVMAYSAPTVVDIDSMIAANNDAYIQAVEEDTPPF